MKKKFTSLLVFVLLISMVLPAGFFRRRKKAKAEHEKIKYDCWKHLFASRL